MEVIRATFGPYEMNTVSMLSGPDEGRVALLAPQLPFANPCSHYPSQTPKETTSMSVHPPALQDETNETQSHIPAVEGPLSAEDPACPETSRGKRSRRTPNFIHHPPDLARHRRKCSICRHPERETIEDLFIHWHSPTTIANYFDDTADAAEDAGDESHNRLRITWVAIYRHAYALGLDEVRRRNLRFAFEHILEQAGDITPTSASIMAAARAYAACVNNDGHWNDPPKQVIVTNITRREPDSPADPLVGATLGSPIAAGAASGVHSGSFSGAASARGRSANESAVSNSVLASVPPCISASESPSSLTDHGTRTTPHGPRTHRH